MAEGRDQRSEVRGPGTKASRTSDPRPPVSGFRPPTPDLRPPASDLTARSGQVVVFLLLALTALAFVLLFNVDLHRIIQRKSQAQNAGDAAALAAARWQGATLNLVGELNLLHLLALANGPPAAVDAITNMQARLCFTGPMTALFAAQIAAKNNRIYVDPDMTALLSEHAATVRTQYAALFDGAQYFLEPWPGAWPEYADMIAQVAADGIAAGPDNAQFFLDPSSGHLLMDKAFYEAVESRNWCWFYLHARGWIESYSSFRDWPPMPDPEVSDYADSEIFGIGLRPFTFPIRFLFSAAALEEQFRAAGFDTVSAARLAVTNVMDAFETWYVYNPVDWTEWTRIKPEGGDDFPVTGPVRPEYDTAGADAVVRVNASVDRMTPGIDGGSRSDKVMWSAAAKPFGYLEGDGGKLRPDSAAAFVLPAFRDVRLIPVDAASGSENSSSDVEWVRHLRSHLRPYLDVGTRSAGCRYCRALDSWEISAFRQEGIDWLELHCQDCRVPSGGGNRRGGGSRRGH